MQFWKEKLTTRSLCGRVWFCWQGKPNDLSPIPPGFQRNSHRTVKVPTYLPKMKLSRQGQNQGLRHQCLAGITTITPGAAFIISETVLLRAVVLFVCVCVRVLVDVLSTAHAKCVPWTIPKLRRCLGFAMAFASRTVRSSPKAWFAGRRLLVTLTVLFGKTSSSSCASSRLMTIRHMCATVPSTKNCKTARQESFRQ